MLVIQRPTVEALGEAEGNRQTVRHQPPRARLRPHARQLAAPHAAVVDPRRSRHPGPLRRRPPRVRHHHGRHRGRHRHHLEPQGPRAAGPQPTSRSPCASTCGARPRSPPATSQLTSRRRDPQPRPAHRHAERQAAAWPSTSPSSRAAATCRPTATRPAATIGVIPVDSIFSPVRRVAFSGRAHPRRAVHRLRPPRARHRDRRLHHAPRGAGLGRRHAAVAGAAGRRDERRARRASSSARSATATAGSPDLDLPIEDLDLSERPRNCLKRAQVNTVGELLAQDRGRPAGHHQLRPEVPRRGHRKARRAGPVAPHQGLVTPCLPPPRRAAASAAAPRTSG